MHPTVLHEDSTLISGDFPAMTRQYLQEHVLGSDCPVLYHTGPSGNQSPRHVTRSNTFDEAARLGGLLGQFHRQGDRLDRPLRATSRLAVRRKLIDLPARTFPRSIRHKKQLDRAAERLETLRRSGADRREVRTAECDWFGAEETLTLARAAASGRLREAIAVRHARRNHADAHRPLGLRRAGPAKPSSSSR